MNIMVIIMIAFGVAALVGLMVLGIALYVIRRNYIKAQGPNWHQVAKWNNDT